jgi:hypothetical protein
MGPEVKAFRVSNVRPGKIFVGAQGLPGCGVLLAPPTTCDLSGVPTQFWRVLLLVHSKMQRCENMTSLGALLCMIQCKDRLIDDPDRIVTL